MLEWLANSYKKFGCALEFVTDRSEEGNQFCKGFGGIGGVLRYSVSPLGMGGALACGRVGVAGRLRWRGRGAPRAEPHPRPPPAYCPAATRS